MEFSDIGGCWQGMCSVDLAWVQGDSIGIIETAKEIDGLGFHMRPLWVEHQVIFASDSHEIF